MAGKTLLERQAARLAKAKAARVAKRAAVARGEDGRSLGERVRDASAARAATFLEGLGRGLSVTHAAKEAGFSRPAAYQRRERDAVFARAWDDAIEAGTDVLEDVATVRATRGVKRPVYQGGKLVGEVTEYSDVLLIFLLKGRRPWKYRDNAVIEHTGPGGGPVRVEVAEARSRLAGRLARLAGGPLIEGVAEPAGPAVPADG